MRLLLICSKRFYDRIPSIQARLERAGHEVLLPNCYGDAGAEARAAAAGEEAHRHFKAAMFRRSAAVIAGVDGVLVLNYDRVTPQGVMPRYIGGATFLEMYDAFRLGRAIFLLYPPPEGILLDEIHGFAPRIVGEGLEGLIPATTE